MITTAKTDDVMRSAATVAEQPEPMLNEAQVLQLIPVARTTLHRMIKKGTFPKGVYVSPNRVLWRASEVARWQLTVNERVPNRGRGPGRRKRVAREQAGAQS
ncbi:AlpA family transcriptional regulator [Bradyrhizobium liaoningense]|uniref:helix-turn-helix transcriptional regulator n=1 Tax=Bradyrhizobium liaoningense TaxID=43992 RepID=UPI001BAB39DC|nr:AlpA family phage regulatory protein [Bradyrhizobium liaoningense]MBR0714044.1 AlpA family phage regulatory protein [Bradyrhizobium liaoningense]